MRRKPDIESIRVVLGSEDVQKKLEILDALDSSVHECDIFPYGILSPALADKNSEVREKTLSLLRYCDEFSDEEYLAVLRMVEDPDEGVRQIALETIIAAFSGLPVGILKNGLQYLWHPDAGVRETAALLFNEFSYLITEGMFMQVIEAYGSAGLTGRKAISEFLERNGHEGLICT